MRWSLLAVGLVTACVTSPFSGTQIQPQRVTSVEFTGKAAPKARLSVAIQALEANGTWTTLGSSPVDADGNWQVPTQVASHYFEPCNRAVFQAVPSDGNAALPGISGPCVQNVNVLPADYSKCRTDLIVLTRPGVSPTQHTGDLTIIGQPQAEQYACYQTIDGNLTVKGGQTGELTLSHLQHVTGDVSVELHHFKVVTPAATTFVLNKFSAPALTQIDGDLTLTAFDDDHFNIVSFDFGLASLTNLGGSVVIDNQGGIDHYHALANLLSIPGDLSIEWTSSDFIESSLLPKLAHVGGDVSIHPEGNLQVVLESLATVDGSLTIDGSNGDWVQPYKVMKNLTTVGGDLTLNSFAVACGVPTFPSLSSVGGQLNLTGEAPRGTFGVPGLNVGALGLTGTAVKALPLPAGFALAPTGSVTIQSNPNLCQCQVDDFVAQLAATGWTGTAATPNNGTAASCAPCPAPSCL
jgi:hypothetical protein